MREERGGGHTGYAKGGIVSVGLGHESGGSSKRYSSTDFGEGKGAPAPKGGDSKGRVGRDRGGASKSS